MYPSDVTIQGIDKSWIKTEGNSGLQNDMMVENAKFKNTGGMYYYNG